MKKKVILISLIIAVVAIAAIGGSLAWFVDDDSVKNVFTFGRIEIKQHEQQRDDTTGKLEPFENGKQLIPVISNDTAKEDVNFRDKIVTVENIGINDAYVQTYVAVPAALDNAGVVHIYDAEAAANGWEKVADVTIQGQSYNVYLYRYTSVLPAEPDYESESVTKPVIDGVYIDMYADLDIIRDAATQEITDAYFVMNGAPVSGFDPRGDLYVYVATQGVQASGFDSYTAALSSAFGTGAASLPDFALVTP